MPLWLPLIFLMSSEGWDLGRFCSCCGLTDKDQKLIKIITISLGGFCSGRKASMLLDLSFTVSFTAVVSLPLIFHFAGGNFAFWLLCRQCLIHSLILRGLAESPCLGLSCFLQPFLGLTLLFLFILPMVKNVKKNKHAFDFMPNLNRIRGNDQSIQLLHANSGFDELEIWGRERVQ